MRTSLRTTKKLSNPKISKKDSVIIIVLVVTTIFGKDNPIPMTIKIKPKTNKIMGIGNHI
jgi:hypothetical protein